MYLDFCVNPKVQQTPRYLSRDTSSGLKHSVHLCTNFQWQQGEKQFYWAQELPKHLCNTCVAQWVQGCTCCSSVGSWRHQEHPLFSLSLSHLECAPGNPHLCHPPTMALLSPLSPQGVKIARTLPTPWPTGSDQPIQWRGILYKTTTKTTTPLMSFNQNVLYYVDYACLVICSMLMVTGIKLHKIPALIPNFKFWRKAYM